MPSWESRSVAGHGVEIYLPAGATRPGRVVVYLHSHEGETLAGKSAFTDVFDALGLACVCPQGGPCWWVDRVCAAFDPEQTPERWLLDGVLPYLASEWGWEPPRIGLLGVGMGGQGALRLGFRHPQRFPVVAAIAPAIEFQLWHGLGYPLDALYASKEQARQDSALLWVHPAKWPTHLFFCVDPGDATWWRGCDRLHEKLSALGVAHECDLTTRAGGHSWEYFNAQAGRAIRFLDAGMQALSRRLL
jgi:pimeloyl-ACP methyl ester carboxylesterase